jgi:hypothetical protein
MPSYYELSRRHVNAAIKALTSLTAWIQELKRLRNSETNSNLRNLYNNEVNKYQNAYEQALRQMRRNVNRQTGSPAFLNQFEKFRKRREIIRAFVKQEKNRQRLANAVTKALNAKGVPRNNRQRAFFEAMRIAQIEHMRPTPGHHPSFNNALRQMYNTKWTWMPVQIPRPFKKTRLGNNNK